MAPSTPTRVVVADDSAMMRQIVSSSLAKAGVQIVGSAANGDEALAVCERQRPDALMLDLAMPGLDGLGVLRALQQPGRPSMPVIVVSAFSPSQAARAVDALAAGAFDLVAKPAIGGDLDSFAAKLVDKVRLAVASRSRAQSNGARKLPTASISASAALRQVNRPRPTRSSVRKAVVIATSTGGPRALAELVPMLPSPLGMGTLIVQHMPPGFTASLAARLDQSSKLNVREAKGGESLDPRVALIAPGGKHLRLTSDGRTSLSDEPEIGGLRPRADITIEDAANCFAERTVLVVLTGMGNDGLRGARAIHRRGGRILSQTRETCTVYGMPRAVAEANLSDQVLPLDQLADAIAQEASA
ncbi:MAG: chemotaxis-specific protein-glutamate methyltransferase CheB [Solirubrobacteraceae bacterium]